jgi:nitrate/nitrite transporter NarK
LAILCLSVFQWCQKTDIHVSDNLPPYMMVEKFSYSVGDISLLFIINYVFNLLFAPKIGKWNSRIGARRALTIEYVGLLIVFISYALVDDSRIAAGLYELITFFSQWPSQ